MDSSGSSLSSLSTTEASLLLKDLLKVGKSQVGPSASGKYLVNGAKESQNGSRSANSSHTMDPYGGMEVASKEEKHSTPNSIADFLKTMSSQSLPQQQIWLQGDDNVNSFAVYGREVDIISSSRGDVTTGNLLGVGSPAPSSNKIKVNPVVKYEWEHKYYIGNLVAVHRNGIYIAYVIKGRGNDGVVRIINRKTAERELLKGFKGSVTDIAFAHLTPIILGAVDEVGNMYIYEIMENDNSIEASAMLQINRPENAVPSENHRLIWCPYIPEDEDTSGATHNTTDSSSITEDVGKLLVLTHDHIAEMWNIDTVTKEYGNGVMTPDEVEVGFLTITSHVKAIVDAAFSPDGTALATASLDGDVKFFQVYLQDRAPPRCLHQWQPHEGRPVSSLFFLDDHKHPNPEVQFWKFAVTGAEENREIKIWSCESWTCLQTVKFSQAVSPDLPTNFQDMTSRPCIKASMDLSANYLVLSDIRRKVLYVLHLHQESEGNAAHVSSISEFMLAHPCLSFNVLDATRRRFKRIPGQETENLGDVTTGEIVLEEDEEVQKKDDGPDIGVVVKMYSVHTKALQELHIAFKPQTSAPFLPTPSISSVSQDGLKDTLSDLSMDTQASDMGSVSQSDLSHHSLTYSEQSQHRSDVLQNSNASNTSHVSYHSSQSRQSDGSVHVEATEAEDKPLLLTPDAFTSPRKLDLGTSTVPDSVRSSSSSSFTHVTAIDEDSLRTPHASVIHSQQSSQPSHNSPGSSITLTPASSKDMSAVGEQITPSSIPLPPVTPGEEAALRSPGDNDSLYQAKPSLTSSPANKPTGEPVSPISSVRTSSDIPMNEGKGDESYEGTPTRRTTLQSTGSSSSTSLEVSEILEGVRPTNQAGEETEEVEEEMYEDAKGDVEETEEEEDEGHVELHQRGDTPKLSAGAESQDLGEETYAKKIWPPPPDVKEVNLEAQRLAADAITRAAYHVHSIEGEEELGPQQEEGDVEIEEEKEEEVGDDNSVPGDIPPPKATSSEIEESLSSIESPTRKSRGSPGPRADIGGRPDTSHIVDAAVVSQLQASVQEMLGMLQFQQREIESLRNELQTKQETSHVMSNLQMQMDNLEGALASRVAASLSEHTQSEAERLQGLLSEKEALERQKQERLLTTVSQTLDRTISSRLDKTVREEMRQRVIPSLARSMDPLKEQLHTEMAQKLTATDAIMKENLSKLVRSRQTVDAIGQAAGNAIQGPVHGTVRDIIIPGFERACQSIFHQVNDAIQRGVNDNIRHLEHHMEQIRKKQEEARDPVVAQLRGMVDAFKRKEEAHEPLYRQIGTLNQTLQQSVSQIQTGQRDLEKHVRQSLIGLEEKLRTEMKEVVKEELTEALKDQQTTISDSLIQCLRSGAVTPAPAAPTPDPAVQQARIMTLLQQGQLNEAFQLALSASDLYLVMYVCEAVNPSQVFNQVPCPLQQPVLLSLIQQLSANLAHQTELKHKYLEEAVMNLDTTNPVTKEHMTAVLGALCQKLMAFVQNHPQEKMTRNIRMLLMATQSLLK